MNSGTDHTSDYKALAVLTKALIGGVLLFAAVSIIIHFAEGAFIEDKNLETTLFTALFLIAVIVILGARLVYSRRISNLMERNQSGKEKLDLFRAITITHMALCEFPAILSILLFLCFGNFLFFLPAAIGLIEMLLKFPTRQRMESIVNSGTF